jgi:hypothetical protein
MTKNCRARIFTRLFAIIVVATQIHAATNLDVLAQRYHTCLSISLQKTNLLSVYPVQFQRTAPIHSKLRYALVSE